MRILTASFWQTSWPGLLAATLLALIAQRFGPKIPWLGSAGLGLLAGLVIANLVPLPGKCKPGLAASGKQILQAAVVLLGAGLNLALVWRTGLDTLFLMLITITTVFAAAYLLGKALDIPVNNRDLIASGTAICGGSAIAAVAPVIGARDDEISYSISVVFLFNLAAVVIFPALGHTLGLNPHAFGMWAGTAVNDTSSVLATSLAYADAAVPVATLVKMTRTVMIVPVALAFSLVAGWRSRRAAEAGDGGKFSFVRVFPWFVLGFLLMSMLSTWGGIPPAWAGGVNAAGKFLIVVALSGIGLNTDLRKILRTGLKPLLLGLCLWAIIGALSLYIIGGMGR